MEINAIMVHHLLSLRCAVNASAQLDNRCTAAVLSGREVVLLAPNVFVNTETFNFEHDCNRILTFLFFFFYIYQASH